MAGRKSKLSEIQWAEFGRRLLEGESLRSLAKEYGVGDTTAREHFEKKGKRSKPIQQVANMIVEAGDALDDLPPEAQFAAINLAQKLRSICESIACAAELGAKTAHRLHALANDQVNKVDDANPLAGESVNSLKAVSTLTKMANDAANIPVNLLAANRDAAKKLVEDAPQGEDDVLTPERRINGVRRIAFLLQKTASEEKH